MRVSLPKPPIRVSLPARPVSLLLPLLPVMMLLAALPVPLMLLTPVKVRLVFVATNVAVTSEVTVSVIVTVLVMKGIVVSTGSVKVMVNFSSASAIVSALTGIVIVLLVSPGAKVSVPAVAVKSVPEVAVSLLVA